MKIKGVNEKSVILTTIWEVDKKKTHLVSAMKKKER